MYRVRHVKAREGYTLEVEFEDGVRGTIDLTDRLFGPVFEPLLDRNFFEQVQVDGYGAVCWPNGADLAPDALHRILSLQSRPSALQES
jgi:hypothetical protein